MRRSDTAEFPASSPKGDEPTRQCGRCRKLFAADPDVEPTALDEWWLCPPCHDALLGNG